MRKVLLNGFEILLESYKTGTRITITDGKKIKGYIVTDIVTDTDPILKEIVDIFREETLTRNDEKKNTEVIKKRG